MKVQINFGGPRRSERHMKYFAGYSVEYRNGAHRFRNGPAKSSRSAAREAYFTRFGTFPAYVRCATTFIAATSNTLGPDRVYRGRHLVGVAWTVSA